MVAGHLAPVDASLSRCLVADGRGNDLTGFYIFKIFLACDHPVVWGLGDFAFVITSSLWDCGTPNLVPESSASGEALDVDVRARLCGFALCGVDHDLRLWAYAAQMTVYDFAAL